MRADRFTALIDSCVLVSALKRNIILSLAEEGFFRPRWSANILSETEDAVARITRADNGPDRARKAVAAIKKAFPEAQVESFDDLIGSLRLPDANDQHVLAAAIQCSAAVLVTDNLKHFPAQELERYAISPISADDFIADAISLSPRDASAALERMQARFKNPAYTFDELIRRMESIGLTASASQWLEAYRP